MSGQPPDPDDELVADVEPELDGEPEPDVEPAKDADELVDPPPPPSLGSTTTSLQPTTDASAKNEPNRRQSMRRS